MTRRFAGAALPVLAAVLVACSGSATPPSEPPPATAERSSATLAQPAPAAGPSTAVAAAADPAAAVVDVAVATLWLEPDATRPLDRPSLTNPVDVKGWVAAMSNADKLWLVGKLATQVLYGERVVVLETRGAWTKVAVPSQPSSLDARGYPGWLPTVQLAHRAAPVPTSTASVTAPTTALRDPDAFNRVLLELSYNTRLPVLSQGRPWVTVSTASGGRALVAASDVAITTGPPRATSVTGAGLVRTAQMFTGLPYLWAGTASAAGFDCSGFTSTVYAAHGIVIPRDADEQATVGTAVEASQLQPGDLLFYAGDGGRGAIHHVSMYAGDGLMIQSPATGKAVETVRVDTPSYARQFWGARRYVPA